MLARQEAAWPVARGRAAGAAAGLMVMRADWVVVAREMAEGGDLVARAARAVAMWAVARAAVQAAAATVGGEAGARVAAEMVVVVPGEGWAPYRADKVVVKVVAAKAVAKAAVPESGVVVRAAVARVAVARAEARAEVVRVEARVVEVEA